VDEIAERILTLRYHPMSNYSEYLKISAIEESTISLTDKEMVEEILNSHSLLLKQMAKVLDKANSIGDEGTIDLIGAYIRNLEKTSWMLDAWNKDKSEKLRDASVR
jgi:starvation-inducible DNA-binding protein